MAAAELANVVKETNAKDHVKIQTSRNYTNVATIGLAPFVTATALQQDGLIAAIAHEDASGKDKTRGTSARRRAHPKRGEGAGNHPKLKLKCARKDRKGAGKGGKGADEVTRGSGAVKRAQVTLFTSLAQLFTTPITDVVTDACSAGNVVIREAFEKYPQHKDAYKEDELKDPQ